jgi:hypothetical protein
MDITMEMEKDKELENVQEGLTTGSSHGEIQSETDLSDHHEGAHTDVLEEEDHKQVDYSDYTKAQLAGVIKDLSKETNMRRVDGVLKEIKPLYDELKEKDRAEALARFIQNGGTAEDFDFKGDEHDIVFDANFKLIRDRKSQFFKQQEEQKQDNLQKKTDLIEKLRALLESQENANQFDQFKQIQHQWKSTGAVPPVHAKTVWANYHALVDRFYDNQSIYFELKELDRRKNLEAKIDLCVRAEKLVGMEIIKDAIKELNELHHEFKHVGPVPKEDKEAVWQRFKVASDTVYSRRDEYLKHLQADLQVNYDQKNKLSDEVMEFVNFHSDRIKEWNEKTKAILDLQKRWEIVGGVPRARAKEVNKKFWHAFKLFFNNKNAFFKKLDEEREHNLQLKHELIQKALALKESHDWEKTSRELKELQVKWKEVGPVPEKFREKIFREFKEACDFFFEQRRGQQDKMEQEQEENLQQKTAVCEELERHAAGGTGSTDLLAELQDRFNAAGFVPRQAINAIKARYSAAVEKFVDALPQLSEDDKSRMLLENQLAELRNDPMADRKIFQKEQAIRKKITKVENDIALWKNNLEFFSRSSKADGVRAEFNDKIKEATDHLKQLKDQLKLLRTV